MKTRILFSLLPKTLLGTFRMVPARTSLRPICARVPWGILAASLLYAANFASGQVLWSDDFDSLGSPITVTNSGTANGYNIRFSAPNGIENFTAVFGFDYSTVT